MSTEACSLVLKNALNEIKNVCPEITSTFVFEETGKIVVQDQETSELAVEEAQEALRALSAKAETIGGIESVAFQGTSAKASITRFNNFYVTNVASNDADEKMVTNLTRVMIPTVLKLFKDINPEYQKQSQETLPNISLVPKKSPSSELDLPEPKAVLNTVENLGFGKILSDDNTAHIDRAFIAQWKEFYGNKNIAEITIENASTGKTLRCAFTQIKDSKYEGKDIIQLPEKIQLALNVKKGEKILLKPIIGNQDKTSTISNVVEPENRKSKATPKTEMPVLSESYVPNAPASQFIVENLKRIGDFLGNSDFVRLDRGVIARWKELFADKEINYVIVQETATGKRLSCKFQPIKDSNLEGKGIIQLPEKIQQALQTNKGALVVVKPVVD
jgi:hypothetical protein